MDRVLYIQYIYRVPQTADGCELFSDIYHSPCDLVENVIVKYSVHSFSPLNTHIMFISDFRMSANPNGKICSIRKMY